MSTKRLFVPYYDDPPPVTPPVPPPPPEGIFTPDQQKKVDEIIKDRLKKTKVEQDKLVLQLDQLRKTKNLTDDEKVALQQRIDDMQSTLFTKEEIAAKEKKEIETRLTKEVEKVQSDAKIWRERFTTETINRALLDSAVEHKAVRPAQIVDLLANRTRLVERADAPGTFIPQVKLNGKDKDGKPVTLDLPVGEAIKQMKEMVEEYGNLFISDANGGIGGTTTTPAGGKSLGDLKDTAKYIEARKKGLTLAQIGIK